MKGQFNGGLATPLIKRMLTAHAADNFTANSLLKLTTKDIGYAINEQRNMGFHSNPLLPP